MKTISLMMFLSASFCAFAQPIPPPVIYPITVLKGGTGGTTAPDDNLMIGTGTVWTRTTIPDCPDTGGNHLNYVQSTNSLSCGTSGGGGGVPGGSDTQIQVNEAGAFQGYADLTFDSSPGLVVNESGGTTADARFETDGRTHALFVDASANSVGINKSSPDTAYSLDIVGAVQINAPSTDNLLVALTSNPFAGLAFGTTSASGTAFLSFRINSNQAAYISYVSESEHTTISDRFYITNNGHLGIGGSDPTASTCGTGASLNGTNSVGSVTVGTGGVTACTITFSSSFPTAPRCFFQSSVMTMIRVSSISGTDVTIETSADVSSGTVDYWCAFNY